MKNIRRFLALSLLLSVPCMRYAMDDDAVFRQLEATMGYGRDDNAVHQALEAAASAKPVEAVVEKAGNAVAQQGWSVDPRNWNYPAMPDLGLQSGLEKAGRPLWNATARAAELGYENVARPAYNLGARGMEGVNKIGGYLNENAGRPLWNASARAVGLGNDYIVRPTYNLGARALSAGNDYVVKPGYKIGAHAVGLGNDYIVRPAAALGARGIQSAGAGMNYAGELAERNPEATAALAFSTLIGGWLLYKYNHPELTNPREERDVQQIIADFKAEHGPLLAEIERQVAQERENAAIAEKIRLHEATERAEQQKAEAERIAKLSYFERARELANGYYPASSIEYARSWYPWGTAQTVSTAVEPAIVPAAEEKAA